MNRHRILIFSTVFIAFFVIGFLGSLALHWSIRPTAATNDVELDATVDTSAFADLDLTTLTTTNEQLKDSVATLENTLAKAEVQRSIDEGHARALILELQTYRQDRDNLFADLEQRKQRLKDKVAELDDKIQAQLLLREQQPTRTDYDLANELLSMLSYPHALNDIADLNSDMLAQPHASKELLQQRFELMLQPEDYPHTDAIYQALQPASKSLREKNNNDFRLLTVFCSQRFCEIQVQMQVVTPYFDYWQQWLATLKSIELTKRIQHQYSVMNNGVLVGTTLISL